jgi:hypothetical protein
MVLMVTAATVVPPTMWSWLSDLVSQTIQFASLGKSATGEPCPAQVTTFSKIDQVWLPLLQ